MPTRYAWHPTPTAWKRRGRPDIPIGGDAGGTGKLTRTQREALTWGTYLPSTANRGLLPGWDANTLTPGPTPNGSGEIFLTTANATYTNTIFYGRVWPRATGITFDNCWFAGWRPTFYCTLDGSGNIIPGSQPAGNVAGCFASAGPTEFQSTMIDCLIDPSPWADATVTTRPGGVAATPSAHMNKYLAYSAGIRGGKLTTTRLEIRGVQDAFAFHQPRANTSDAAFTRMYYPYLHDMHYYQGPDFALPEGTHTDGIQTQTGRDFQFYRGYITGAHNAGATLKQEVSGDILMRIEDFIIEETIFEDDGGNGGALINHVYVADRASSWGGTTAIRNNLLVQRQAGGKVINRHANYAGLYSGNRLVTLNPDGSGWTDIGAAPITNG